jgi:pimeloyl-ACP methyl ester carboxylesterase
MVTTGYLEHDVHVRDMKFHYQEWGNPSAPTIVMLHGFGVSGHMFDEFAERMQDRYHLIALDQRGHGDSDWAPEGDYSRDAYVTDLEGFRETLGIGRFILVGHSMGGLISVGYTVRNPGVVRALVLVDVGPEASREGVENIQRFTRGPDELDFEEFVQMAHRFNQRRTLENIRERMRHRLKQTDSGKWTWKFDKRFREAPTELRIGSQLSNDEMWQMFRGVEAPTLLVRGAESDVLSPAVAERAVSEMRRARLVTVPAAGHSVPGDNPDDFTAAVTEFLGDLEMGRFEPASASEPPPLDARLDADTMRRRGGHIGTFLLAGLGATVALGVAAFAVQRATSKRKQQTLRARAEAAALYPGRSVDLDHARRRALELVAELSAVGQAGVSRARATLQEVDLERARATARDLAHTLGDSSLAVRERVGSTRVRAGHKRRRGHRSVLSSGLALAAGLLNPPRKKSRSRWLAWRS